MSWVNPSNETVKEILESAETIAVVGLSDNPERTSYQISKIMQDQGYTIIPVNPKVDEVLGEKAYDSLTEVDGNIDIINVFRRSEFLPDIAKEAAQTDCRIFWAQQGLISQEAYDYLQEREFTVIMDMCIKVAHSVLVK
ncbi:CoA-binding protein [Lentibacillus sp. CBA3610]|uniref:CoA-binding protein n=1 Tax=Lentibacillus sp. CBA3610 TaxID=2518176 RepID=UPI0015957FC4|nr:CoA-binding protein [Lentibacillus sp. CBA3610]QKY69127.1 CoA-binding protein [Lentibacillus sp. CBA3610]